jgi:hypothetical protein
VKQQAKVIEIVTDAMQTALRSGSPSISNKAAAAMNAAAMDQAVKSIMELIPKE